MTLEEHIERRDVDAIKSFMAEHRLVVKGNRIVAADPESMMTLKSKSEFWNQRQQARKILKS